MEENSFWMNVWRLVGGVLIAFMAVTGGCCVHQQSLVASAIAAGADPIKARCAIFGMDGPGAAAICATAAAR